MRLAESPEQHFTEGEPDIEPPEELAVSEVDDVALHEEELDTEDVLEQDVEEDVLEETLEDLVHHDDADDDMEAPAGLLVSDDVATEADEDTGGEADLEEGLDLVLEHRLAVLDERTEDDEEGAGEGAGGGGPVPGRNGSGPGPAGLGDDIRPCGPDEFTCRACFLVHSRQLLADERAMTCRDCAS